MPIAHSLRSTGVRFAAWTNGSRSCVTISKAATRPPNIRLIWGCAKDTYVKVLGCWPLGRTLVETLLDHILKDLREGVTLRQFRGRLMNDLLKQVKDTSWRTLRIRQLLAGGKRELADGEFHDGQAETPHVRLYRVLLTL